MNPHVVDQVSTVALWGNAYIIEPQLHTFKVTVLGLNAKPINRTPVEISLWIVPDAAVIRPVLPEVL